MDADEYNDIQGRRETERYMQRLVQLSVVAIIVGFILDILAALVSHIALWQVLLWLCFTSVVASILLFSLQWWIGQNNLNR